MPPSAIPICRTTCGKTGRKASLIAGGDGKRVQLLVVDPSPEWLALARVDGNGDARVYVGYVPRNDPRAEHEPAYYANTGVLVGFAVQEYTSPPALQSVHKQVDFQALQTPEMLLVWEAARPAEVAASKARAEEELRPILAEW